MLGLCGEDGDDDDGLRMACLLAASTELLE